MGKGGIIFASQSFRILIFLSKVRNLVFFIVTDKLDQEPLQV